ncbi:protein CNGC15b-like [Zingiber officinale]|uniref:protein CNGC15b-like n=1 Tax=Zingiber officinale TaxID=94328 RepID=UPI001C4ACB6A|nr:protein CNGC15b-like [Zingiber officinale]
MAAGSTSRSVRFKEEVEFAADTTEDMKPCKSFKNKVLSRVFSEDYEFLIGNDKRLFDPRSPAIQRWNKVLLAASLVSLFLDPLFFYIPETPAMECIDIGTSLEVALTALRTLADIFYGIQIYVRFRTAFVAPSSRVFGRGELVVDPSRIASRYLARGFWVDLVASVPLPQLMIWVVIPSLKDSTVTDSKNFLRFSIIFQYLPRLFLIFPLSERIIRMTGVMTENAWAGAAYNLILYMLASHVIGASWYLLSIERQEACWRAACQLRDFSCQYKNLEGKGSDGWKRRSELIGSFCNPSNDLFQFGIYADALEYNVTSSSFVQKYFYCFWWGLKNLSCLGQNLSTSMSVSEISFAIVIAVLGLVLFGLLIGNMQSYLQSTTARLEEWRVTRTDTEQWMRHRQLPAELKQSVRRYHQFRWVATRGVDEEALLKGLPVDLRRDIKRHLCLDLVRRVPLFDEMDERMLEAICERLRPALCTRGTCLVRELDPVGEMLFIIRGYVDSTTTNGGRSGFFNWCRIGPGEFCGEELLTWALDPRLAAALPLSTRTVEAVTEVEAFALVAEDLKFVASQFRRMHSKQVQHKLRFYSQQWRMWAACFIQAAWGRQKRRRASMELRMREGDREAAALQSASVWSLQPSTEAKEKSKTKEKAVAGGKGSKDGAARKPALKKPREPDFSLKMEEEEN